MTPSTKASNGGRKRSGAEQPKRLTHTYARVGIALALGACAAVIAAMWVRSDARALIVLLSGYAMGAATYLVLTALVLVRASAEELRRHADTDDPGRATVLPLIVFGSAISVGTALILLRGTVGGESATTLMILTIASTVLAWCVTHTAYALHYAHLHYKPPKGDARNAGGFEFPGGDDPDGLDFAYLAFTVGMTFQVSDTQVLRKACRRSILKHAAVSFAYNTLLIAMVVNAALSLAQRSH